MKDSRGNIIYIGKSKCLNKRVKSYFQFNPKSNKIKTMIFNIHDIDFVVTDTHLEAQLLECELIKKLKPIYNTQFKNDKKYVYLKVENYNKSNALSVTLDRENEHSFGPYRSRNLLLKFVDLLKNLYPLKRYGDLYNFNYSPLLINMKKEDFEENRQCLLQILSQTKYMNNFMLIIKEKMKEASSSLQFERASYYKDILMALEYLYNLNKNNILKDRKILVGDKIDDGYKLFYISDGNLVFKRKFYNLTAKNVNKFLSEVKSLKNNIDCPKSEKNNLDFKLIINNELRTNPLISTLFINESCNLKLFVNNLQKI
ncbi:GIY-YIG nuclease family protein [Schnuerera sp. xch1]|nr:GIY-YIG nuclease family protein [Schnuerera sp. xch1]